MTIPEGLLFIQTIQSPFEGTSHDPATAATRFGGCNAATVTLADGSQLEMTLSRLDIGDLGDAGVGYSMVTYAVNVPGRQGSSAMLSADVVDGDRVVTLGVFAGTSETLTEDTVAEFEDFFLELVVTAFEYQHDALG